MVTVFESFNDVGVRIAGIPELVPPVLASSYLSQDSCNLAYVAEQVKKDLVSLVKFTAVNASSEVVEQLAILAMVSALKLLPVIGPIAPAIIAVLYGGYMALWIADQIKNKEYYAAAGTILHALFDECTIIGAGYFNISVPEKVSSALDSLGLGFIKTPFIWLHDQLEAFTHYLNDPCETEGTQQQIATWLENHCCSELNCETRTPLSCETDAPSVCPPCNVIVKKKNKIRKPVTNALTMSQ